MAYQPDFEPISKQLTIVIGLTVVGFMAFGLALSFYRNILFEQTLRGLEEKNKEIARSIERGYSDLEYYRSDQYKDKYAKENLGRMNPGEKVLIITQGPRGTATGTGASAAQLQRQEAAYFEVLRQMPVLEHWRLYFFHRDTLEEFRKGVAM